MEPSHLNFIKKLGYIPVGLGDKKFSKEWMKDDEGKNISKKNKYYGEYTFHYWIWKNYIDQINDKWIGFCQYRKFWSVEKTEELSLSIEKIDSLALKNIPEEYKNYDVILGNPLKIKSKFTKFIKKNLILTLKNPMVFFSEKARNINFHFDLMHGEKNLSKAIDLLNIEDKKDFDNFVKNNSQFNPHNMFICKSNDTLKSYYDVIFPWLERCEEIFGFENLKGYDLTRMYGFLAERFLSYWFQKNTKFKTMPILFYDIRKDLG
tara:strand:- start:562 stop:1350 length:789 start_codon:yes stop_codon:yes gene_type:complete